MKKLQTLQCSPNKSGFIRLSEENQKVVVRGRVSHVKGENILTSPVERQRYIYDSAAMQIDGHWILKRKGRLSKY